MELKGKCLCSKGLDALETLPAMDVGICIIGMGIYEHELKGTSTFSRILCAKQQVIIFNKNIFISKTALNNPVPSEATDLK